MSDTKTENKPAEPKAAPAAKASTEGKTPFEAAGLVRGKNYRFVAVHGDICHYENRTRFATDDSVKHEADAWVEIQFNAGKLRLEADEE
jgi:hypothetical protein